ncbi:MAG: 50S ribosomal protein L17 [Candidatus Cyclobacteriaceae bacterium M2_1C_046]
MRHGKSFNHLGRTASHRQAMLSNMASSLIVNRRITTTVAKAKALRQYVEPLITKAKNDTTHSRRVVFSYLQDKDSVQSLFNEVAAKVADRPGGYTRIIKLADSRMGDNAEMCMIELVDYNDLLLTEKEPAKKTRRSRRGGGGSKSSTTAEATEQKTEAKAKPAEEKSEEPKAEEKKEEGTSGEESKENKE